jgi:predicted nicotinamide N-methyase
MDRKPGQPIRIFYSYAKEDSELQEELEKHLSPLQQRGLIEPWSNRLINAGKEWANEIDQHIKSSDIILLLLSGAVAKSVGL